MTTGLGVERPFDATSSGLFAMVGQVMVIGSILVADPGTSPSIRVSNQTCDQTSVGTPVGEEPSTAVSIAFVRRVSGLTWDELADLFDVSRRSVHFWASGKPLSPENEWRLRKLVETMRAIDRGSAAENRTLLSTPTPSGLLPLDLLRLGQFEKTRVLLESGRRRVSRVLPVSAAWRELQEPKNAVALLDTVEDTPHPSEARSRSVRRKPRRGA